MKISNRALPALLCGTSLALSFPAFAQSDATASAEGTNDIIVTAQRRAESLQRVPIAVTAIQSEQLEARQVRSISGLTRTVTPGFVAVTNAGAPSSTLVNVRGVATPDVVGLAEQGVSVYVDGVPLGRLVGSGVELGDIERIEVLRGPQGTLFGRNAEGGAIQYITKRPTGELGGRVEGEYGNYDHRRLVGQLNLPEFANISIKVGGFIDRNDGYVKNAPLGPQDVLPAGTHNDFGLYDAKGVRVAAIWRPSDNFSAYYTFDKSWLDFTNQFTMRTGGRLPSEPAFCAVPSFQSFCAPAAFAANVYQNTQQPIQGRPKVSPTALYRPINTNKVTGHSLTLDLEASESIQIKSITGYRKVTDRQANNLGGGIVFVQFVPATLLGGPNSLPVGTRGAVGGASSRGDAKQDQFSQELQFIGDFNQLQLTAGLFYFTEDVDDVRETSFTTSHIYTGTAGLLSPVQSAPFPLGVNAGTGVNNSRQQFLATAKSYAAYMQGTWTPGGFDERLRLTAGIRYTNDEKVFNRVVFGGGPDNTRSVFKENRFDPAFIIAYDVTPDVNIYGKYSSAYRAGGVNIRNQVALSPYGAEVNKAFEGGIKSRLFDGQVRWNLAFYHSTINGYQIVVGNNPANAASTTTVNLAQKVKFSGVESELTVTPVENLTLSLNGAYMHADAPDTLVTPAGGTIKFILPYSPKWQASVSADYSIPLNDEMKILLHADYNYMSTNFTTPFIPLPARTAPAAQSLHQTNARIAVEGIPLGGLKGTLGFYVHNLFDVDDYVYTFSTQTNDPTVAAQPGGAGMQIEPRRYGVQLKVEF